VEGVEEEELKKEKKKLGKIVLADEGGLSLWVWKT
jgi:hypothetical protein